MGTLTMTNISQDQQLVKDIAELKQGQALQNQFNTKVIEPFIKKVELNISQAPTRKEHDDLRADHESLKQNTVSRAEFRLVTTIVTVTMGVIISGLTIWDKLKG